MPEPTAKGKASTPALLHIFSTFDAAGPQKRTLEIIRSTAGQFAHFIVAMDGNFRAASTLAVTESGLLRLMPPPPIVPGDLASFNAVTRKVAAIWRLLRNAVWLRGLIGETRPALILTYNLGAASGLLAANLFCSTPVLHSEDGFSGDEKQGLAWARHLLRRILTWNVATIVVPSYSLLRMTQEKLRLHCPVKLIQNGIRSSVLKHASHGDSRAALGIPDAALVIGCVAHLRPEKGHLTLLRAFAHAALPDAILLLLGEGPTRPAIQDEISRLNLETRVLLLGGVNQPATYYPLMDVFALASDAEQMPMALLEAMVQGLPVICTNVGDCQQMLGAQLFPAVHEPGDVSGLGHALQLLAGSPELRLESATRNRQRCDHYYRLEPMLRSYQDLYSALIESRLRTDDQDAGPHRRYSRSQAKAPPSL